MDEESSIDNLLHEKENELKEIQNLKVKALQNKLREKENQYQLLDLKYKELQNDFEHNLLVIKDRDDDIQELTDNIMKLKDILEEKQIMINELHDQLVKDKKEHDDEIQSIKNKNKGLYDKLEDLKSENKVLKSGQSDDIKRYKGEYEKRLNILQDMINNNEKTISNLVEENNIKSKVITENDKKNNEIYNKLMQEFKAEKEKLIDEYVKKMDILENEKYKIYDDYNHKIQEYQHKDREITELKHVNMDLLNKKQDLEKELEILKMKINKNDNTLKDQIDNLILEKEKLIEKVSKTKSKYKNKISTLKSLHEKKTEELIRENNLRCKKYENDLKKFELDYEKLQLNEKSLKEKCQELEFKLAKEQRLADERNIQLSKNLEQDYKKLQNEIELKKMQYNHLLEEKNELIRKNDEFQHAIRDLEQKLAEIEKENNFLIEEVAFFRKDNPNIKFDHNKQLGDSNRQLQQQQQQNRGKSSPHKIQTLKNDKEREKEREKAIKVKEDDALESINSENEPLFSEDLGPVSPLHSIESKSQVLNFNKNLSKPSLKNDSNKFMNALAENLRLANEQLRWANEENIELKNTIKKLREEMENVLYRYQTNNQELQNNKEIASQLRSQYNTVQQELYLLKEKELNYIREKNEMDKHNKDLQHEKKQLHDELRSLNEDIKNQRNINLQKEQELLNLKKTILQIKNENEKIKTERDQLIEISNNLRSKLNRLEDSKANKNSNNEEILELENEIQDLREQLLKLQEVDDKKQMIIEKIKTHLPKTIKYENLLAQIGMELNANNSPTNQLTKKNFNPKSQTQLEKAERDNMISADNNTMGTKSNFGTNSLNKPKTVENIKKRNDEAKTDLMIESKPKQISGKYGDYTSNSEKQTLSQKEVEEKLRSKRKKSPNLVRNYNLKDDDQFA